MARAVEAYGSVYCSTSKRNKEPYVTLRFVSEARHQPGEIIGQRGYAHFTNESPLPVAINVNYLSWADKVLLVYDDGFKAWAKYPGRTTVDVLPEDNMEVCIMILSAVQV